MPDSDPHKTSQGPSKFDASPLPASQGFPAPVKSLPLLPVVNDRRAMTRLLGVVLRKSGLSPKEVASLMGISYSTMRAYMSGTRDNPTISWFLRFVEVCGGRVRVDFK